MKLEIADVRRALECIEGSVGIEAEIAAQLVLDIAVAARYAGRQITPEEAQKMLRERIARHHWAQPPVSNTIH